MENIPEVFKYLASLKMQEKYIVHGTAAHYLLPEDLIEDAYSFLFERDFFSNNKSKAVKKLKKAVKAFLACPVDIEDNRQFVYECKPWIDLRNKAKAFLEELGFDLETWEQKN